MIQNSAFNNKITKNTSQKNKDTIYNSKKYL